MIEVPHDDDFLRWIFIPDYFGFQNRHLSIKKLSLDLGLNDDFFPFLEEGEDFFFLPSGEGKTKPGLLDFFSLGRKAIDLDQIRKLEAISPI